MKRYIVTEGQLNDLSVENRNYAYSAPDAVNHRFEVLRAVEARCRAIEYTDDVISRRDRFAFDIMKAVLEAGKIIDLDTVTDKAIIAADLLIKKLDKR